MGSQCVNKQHQDLVCQRERLFPNQLPLQWSMNLIKVLWCRFHKCLETFTMLLFEGFSELILFRHLHDHVFGVCNSGNTKSARVIFSSKYLKIKLDLKNTARNEEKDFSFCDNCILIGNNNLSLLRTGYFSSAANVLTSSPKIWDINKRDFFLLNWLCNDHWIWKRCCGVDFNSAWRLLPRCLSKGPLKRDFWDIYMTAFSETVILEIQNLWGSYFFEK